MPEGVETLLRMRTLVNARCCSYEIDDFVRTNTLNKARFMPFIRDVYTERTRLGPAGPSTASIS